MKSESRNFAFLYYKDGHFTYCGPFARHSPEQVKLGKKLLHIAGSPGEGDHLTLIETIQTDGCCGYVIHGVTETELQAITNQPDQGRGETT